MKNNSKKWWLYVLKLEHGKYYVGITSKTTHIRLAQHKNGFMAARWTKKYRPIEIIYQEDLGVISYEEAQNKEENVTRMYINIYGLNNVRGGDLTDDKGYISRFHRIYTIDNWKILTTILLLVVINLYLVVLYYLK